MKKYLSVILLAIFICSITGCADSKWIDDKERKPIGIINIVVNDATIMEPKYPDIQYEVCWGNVIWGALLVETIIAPIYFFGFSMFEPVGKIKK